MSDTISRLRGQILGLYSAVALRLLSATWRLDAEGLNDMDNRLAAGEKLIAIFWHGKYYALLPLLRNRDAVVFTSVSSRGRVIANILRRFGFHSVQLPDHGGDRSLGIMRDAMHQYNAAAIAVDGPLGPYHVVHRGAVQLASELGHSIIPLSIAASKKTVLSERWDRFEIPRIFSKIKLVVGEPIRIPPDLDANALEQWIELIHDALIDVDEKADALLTDRTSK